MKAPSFWQTKNFLAYLCLPLSLLWYCATLLRKLQRTYHSKRCFVICVGNLNVGGAGKTPTVIALYHKLHKALLQKNLNLKIVILCKTYKATIVDPTFVYSYHQALEIGDEALMISQYCPTIVAKNRQKALKFLEDKNIDIVIMDDGLQNPTFSKHYNILVVNGLIGFGNNFLLPAGPLRETWKSATKKINAIISYDSGIEQNSINSIKRTAKKEIPIIQGKILVTSNIDLKQNYLPFCGIANPVKFVKTLQDNHIKIENLVSFSDHHRYTNTDINKLILQAKKNNLTLLTTEKDYVKIPQKYRSLIKVITIKAQFHPTNQLIDNIMHNIEQHPCLTKKY